MEHIGLVRFHADRLSQRYPIPVQELESHGMIGLLKAAETYDPSRCTKPETWFAHKIISSILDGIREHAPLKRMHRRAWPEAMAYSLDARPFDKGPSFGELLKSSEADPAWTAEQNDTFEYLTRGLAPREQLIAHLCIREGLTMRKIATMIASEWEGYTGITEGRVCQLWTRRIKPSMQALAAKLVA